MVRVNYVKAEDMHCSVGRRVHHWLPWRGLPKIELRFPCSHVCPDAAVAVVANIAMIVSIRPLLVFVAAAMPEWIFLIREPIIANCVHDVRAFTLYMHVAIGIGRYISLGYVCINFHRRHIHFEVVLSPFA